MSTTDWLAGFESNLRTEFAEWIAEGRLPETQIAAMVSFEGDGIAASEFVGSDWCRCASSEGAESYFRKPGKGTHGMFHDPRAGGCGGITQTG